MSMAISIFWVRSSANTWATTRTKLFSHPVSPHSDCLAQLSIHQDCNLTERLWKFWHMKASLASVTVRAQVSSIHRSLQAARNSNHFLKLLWSVKTGKVSSTIRMSLAMEAISKLKETPLKRVSIRNLSIISLTIQTQWTQRLMLVVRTKSWLLQPQSRSFRTVTDRIQE